MDASTKRVLAVGGVATAAVVGLILLTRGSASAATVSSQQPPPNPPNPPNPPTGCSWRPLTQSEANNVISYYGSQMQVPVGTELLQTIGGKQYKFVTCSGGNCTPPSEYQKDVRGFICE